MKEIFWPLWCGEKTHAIFQSCVQLENKIKKKANEEALMMKMSIITFNSTNYQWSSSHKNYNLKPYGNGNKSILVTNVENINT